MPLFKAKIEFDMFICAEDEKTAMSVAVNHLSHWGILGVNYKCNTAQLVKNINDIPLDYVRSYPSQDRLPPYQKTCVECLHEDK